MMAVAALIISFNSGPPHVSLGSNVDSGSVVICKETNKTTDVTKNDANVSQLFQKKKNDIWAALCIQSKMIVIVKFSKN